MRTIYCHIGMHKTGTTTLQAFLDKYDDGKKKYAELSSRNHSIAFFTAFTAQNRIGSPNKRGLRAGPTHSAKASNFLNQIVACLQSDREKDLIFSGEAIGTLPTSAVHRLAEVFRRYCDSVIIIVYMRDPISFVTSAFQRGSRTA